MSLVIKQTRVVEVPVTELHVCQNIMAMTTMLDADGAVCGHAVFPMWIPQVLEINLATGQIKNWQVPTVDQLQHIADAYADGQSAAVAPSPEYTEFASGLKSALQTLVGMPVDSNPLDIDGIKTDDSQGIVDSHFAEIEEGIVMFGGVVPDVEPATKKPSVDIGVSFSKAIGKWVADVGNDVVGEHQATSTQGKFEAIKNVLKKAGLHGVYEINQRDSIDDVEFYSYDDSRTKDRTTVYVGGHEISKGYTARTSTGQKYTAASQSQALDGLIANVLKVAVPHDAIVDTTDDAMLFAEKWRYSIDMAKAVAIVEPEPTTNDIEDAPEPRQPARARYRNPNDHSQTWTGRGKPPEWLQAKLDAGEQLTDYAISDSAA